jgi:hypothetical protein
MPASPEAAAHDEYLRLIANKIAAEALLDVATEKRKAEAAAKAAEPKLRASKEFAEAYHAGSPQKPRPKTPRSKTRSRPNGSA